VPEESRGGGQIEIQGEDWIVKSHQPARAARKCLRRDRKQ
jgi:membrane protein implicated in regulation of membrane protease activity